MRQSIRGWQGGMAIVCIADVRWFHRRSGEYGTFASTDCGEVIFNPCAIGS